MSGLHDFYGHALPGLEPLDRDSGTSRGEPIDRWYVDRFLSERESDRRGRVREIATPDEIGGGLPRSAFDCVVVTDALHLVFDVRLAIASVREAIAPGGVVLATLPGVGRFDRRRGGDHWRFTEDSARRLFAAEFGEGNVEVEVFGNVLVATAFLYGYALEDLSEEELSARDPQFPFLIGVRASA